MGEFQFACSYLKYGYYYYGSTILCYNDFGLTLILNLVLTSAVKIASTSVLNFVFKPAFFTDINVELFLHHHIFFSLLH